MVDGYCWVLTHYKIKRLITFFTRRKFAIEREKARNNGDVKRIYRVKIQQRV